MNRLTFIGIFSCSVSSFCRISICTEVKIKVPHQVLSRMHGPLWAWSGTESIPVKWPSRRFNDHLRPAIQQKKLLSSRKFTSKNLEALFWREFLKIGAFTATRKFLTKILSESPHWHGQALHHLVRQVYCCMKQPMILLANKARLRATWKLAKVTE